MIPFLVLLIVFCVALMLHKIFQGNLALAQSGRIAMSVMVIFTAISHFIYTKGMAMMLPDFIPFKIEIIWLTGILEIGAAIGLLLSKYRTTIAWLLIILLVLMLPANIYAAIHQIDYQNASYGSKGLSYLWFRVPLQILFILWTYFSSIKN